MKGYQMNRRQKAPPLRVRNPAHRQAFERLDGALEKNAPVDYSERSELLGHAIFGDLWDIESPRQREHDDVPG